MSFWERFGDLLEILGQRLETPEYLICFGGDWHNPLSHHRPAGDSSRPSTSAPAGADKLFTMVETR
jgi:hypothetical protein